MIHCKSEAASLITAYKQCIVPIMEPHGLDVVDDFTVVGIDFLRILGFFFLVCVATK